MASRQEEKERRRREREEREAAAAAKSANRRRLQLVGGAIIAIAAIVVLVIVIAGSGGGGSSTANDKLAHVPIPPQKIDNLDAAAKAAGCMWKIYPEYGHTHVADTATPPPYKTNPPTSGTHRITPAADGVYDPGNEPDPGNAVHALEHGRIEIEYRKGTSKHVIDQLETLYNEKVHGVSGYHELLFQNNTNMPYAVAAVAWTRLLGCPTMNPRVFDAIRAFRSRFVDKGREQVM